jgi:hypothetical protein
MLYLSLSSLVLARACADIPGRRLTLEQALWFWLWLPFLVI